MTFEPYTKRPFDVGIEEDNIYFGWAYGPQGHPASMRIYIDLDVGNKYIPVFWISTNSNYNSGILPLEDPKVLLKFFEYGEKIDEAFPQSWDWHFCSGCKIKPIHSGCVNCRFNRACAEKDAADFFAANPVPTL